MNENKKKELEKLESEFIIDRKLSDEEKKIYDTLGRWQKELNKLRRKEVRLVHSIKLWNKRLFELQKQKG
jgi:hypothetical protein